MIGPPTFSYMTSTPAVVAASNCSRQSASRWLTAASKPRSSTTWRHLAAEPVTPTTRAPRALPSCPAIEPTAPAGAAPLADCSGERADGAGGRRDDHRVARLRLADVLHPQVRGDARVSERA